MAELTILMCNGNQLTSLDISDNDKLIYIDFAYNKMEACTLDNIYKALKPTTEGEINNADNFGSETSNTKIATDKGWKVTLVGDGTGCASSVSEEEEIRFAMVLYPNPAKDILNIKLSNYYKSEKLIITDLLGKIIYSQPITTDEITIDVSKLIRGIYLIKIDNKVKKLILR